MEKEKSKKRLYWTICCLFASLLCVLTFTSVIIPYRVYQPSLSGFPYTFWTGILIAVCLVILTFIGARVHPKE